MPQSYLIFEFGTNEETAQQARHRLEGWKQAFRLGEKLQLKFERQEAEKAKEQAKASSPEPARGKAKEKNKVERREAKAQEAKRDHAERIRLLVRLDFSDHERLSHQRWLERIPTEEPFKSASKQIIRPGEEAFESTAELFDSL